jgi:hypothetical protein
MVSGSTEGDEEMVRFVRTAKVVDGKLPEAITFAKGHAETLQASARAAPDIEIFVNPFGDGTTIHWMADYEDISALHNSITSLIASRDYWKHFRDAFDKKVLVEGSIHDMVTQRI